MFGSKISLVILKSFRQPCQSYDYKLFLEKRRWYVTWQQTFVHLRSVQVILFEIDCVIFYTNLHELFCQFISWTNWVYSSRIMSKYGWYKKVYNNLIIINLYEDASIIHFINDLYKKRIHACTWKEKALLFAHVRTQKWHQTQLDENTF